MTFLRIKSIIIINAITFLLLGCSEQSTQSVGLLTKFLPFENNATKYIYKTTTINEGPTIGKMKSKNIYTEKIVTSKNNNCIFTDNYTLFDEEDISQMPTVMKKHIKNNKIKGISEQLCVNKNKIYFNNSITLYQRNNNWTVEVQAVFADGQEKTIEAECNFISLSKEIILGKRKEVIHTQCKYEIEKREINTIDWFMAEGLGLYKIIMTTDDKNTNSYSIITTSLSQYN